MDIPRVAEASFCSVLLNRAIAVLHFSILGLKLGYIQYVALMLLAFGTTFMRITIQPQCYKHIFQFSSWRKLLSITFVFPFFPSLNAHLTTWLHYFRVPCCFSPVIVQTAL